MAVFTDFIAESNTMYESILPDVSADSLLMDESVEPCREDNFLVAGARICAEGTENMNRIMEACAIQEFCYFSENGTEMVYEGGKITGFIEKAKQWFLNLWKKIQGVFKKAIMMFNTKAKSDKDFLSKYKTELTKAKNKDYGDTEIDMYDYIFYDKWSDLTLEDTDVSKTVVTDAYKNVATLAGCNSSLATNLNSLIDKDKIDESGEDKKLIEDIRDEMSKISESDWKEDEKDKTRGNLVKKLDSSASDSITASEFVSDIAEACQGDTTKDKVNLSVAVNKAVNFLDKSNDITKNLDNWLKSWKKSIDNEIRALDQKSKYLDKLTSNKNTNAGKARVAGYHHTMLSAAIGLDQSRKQIGIAFHSAVIQQLKNCSGQSKAICVKAVNYKKPKNESYAYTEESTGSLLDSIELI